MDDRADSTPQPTRPALPPRRGTKGSKWIGRGFILLWVVAVVAVYIVIVRLKINGERALRTPEPAPGLSESAPRPIGNPAP